MKLCSKQLQMTQMMFGQLLFHIVHVADGVLCAVGCCGDNLEQLDAVQDMGVFVLVNAWSLKLE